MECDFLYITNLRENSFRYGAKRNEDRKAKEYQVTTATLKNTTCHFE